MMTVNYGNYHGGVDVVSVSPLLRGGIRVLVSDGHKDIFATVERIEPDKVVVDAEGFGMASVPHDSLLIWASEDRPREYYVKHAKPYPFAMNVSPVNDNAPAHP